MDLDTAIRENTMITKTVRTYKRHRRSWHQPQATMNDVHVEKYHRETWWLFGFIPLYVRDTIIGNNL